MGQKKKERVKRPSRPKSVSTGPVSSDPMPGWLKTDKAIAAGESFFRPVDWLAFGITTLVTLLGYCLTISPDLTLEDCGELAVGSMYAGVPHPPGYPVWTLYTWLFTKLVPISNIAFRVALSSAVAAALSSGLLALLTCRASARIIESIDWFNAIDERLAKRVTLVGGCVAGLMLGFSGFMWSQAVIVEVYTLSVLSLMGVLCCLYRWTQDTAQMRYLYWTFFWFGICLCNHQTLIVAAMGIESVILFAHPRLGRNFFTVNALVYLAVLVAMATGTTELFSGNTPMQVIFHMLGVIFIAVAGSLWLVTLAQDSGRGGFNLARELRESLKIIWSSLAYAGGAAFYLFLPLASMTNPPLNWGYPRTWLGFMHAFTRGQYQQTNPTTDFFQFLGQIRMYIEGAADEFGVFMLLAILPFVLLFKMKNRERGWVIGSFAIYICLAGLLMILLNPTPDKHGRDMTRVFFAASHVVLAMWIGFGSTLFCALVARRYFQTRLALGFGLVVAAALAMVAWSSELAETQFFLNHWTRAFAFCLVVFLAALFLVHRDERGDGRSQSLSPMIVLIVLALLPVWSILAHWGKNEQHGHLFGFWYGHDMFTPPFTESDGQPIYPEMSENAILFGGTDPGRFNPTYMIFAESFTDPAKRRDSDFDRRDVALITQNALADSTYLDTVRAHYQRSEQIDWKPEDPSYIPFASGAKNKLLGTNLLSGLATTIDKWMIGMGSDWEIDRRTSGSYFEPGQILKPSALAKRIAVQDDELARFLLGKLSDEGRGVCIKQPGDTVLRNALAKDFNAIIDGDPIWDTDVFAGIEFSGTTLALREQVAALGKAQPNRVEENGRYIRWRQARVRLNRRLLDELLVDFIQPGLAGLYPDLELNSPTQMEAEIAFAQYLQEADAREKAGALKPGEIVNRIGDRVSVAGQVSVMQINSKLAKLLFDNNPDRDFFIEVSFPLEWMYPHLTPYGIILKLNRDEVPEITDEMMRKDRLFWAQYQTRLTGNWITDDTSIKEIGEWAVKTYQRWDLNGYTGDPAFVRDEPAQKSFSKLRTSIADIYRWRINNYKLAITKEADAAKRDEMMQKQERMTREYIFALKQAWAFCPYSPEVLSHFTQLLLSLGYDEFQAGDKAAANARRDDAIEMVTTYERFDPDSPMLRHLIRGIQRFNGILEGKPAATGSQATPEGLNLSDQDVKQIQQQLVGLQQRHRANPADSKVTLELATIYLRLKQDEQALKLLDSLVKQPGLEISTRLTVASVYQNLGQGVKADQQNGIAREELKQLEAKLAGEPGNFELALDLATTHVQLGQAQRGVDVLAQTIQQPTINTTNLLMAAQFFNHLGSQEQLESALVVLTQKMPDSPEGWYDLAAVQASQRDRMVDSWATLAKALALDKQRRATNAAADNIYNRVAKDPRFTNVRRLPEFKAWQP
jgi:Tfp pilus assembly protein PilF